MKLDPRLRLKRLSASWQHQLETLAPKILAHRQEKQRLRRRLATLTADYNLLTRERDDMRHRLKLENRGLRSRYEDTKAERDDLQLEVWELEDLVEELFQLLTSVEVPPKPEPESDPVPDIPFGPVAPRPQATEPALAGIKLALVGGHDATRQGTIRELSQYHGLKNWVELPPFSKHALGRSNIKAKIHDCDLIVLITGYMRHGQTDSIMQLRRLKSLSGAVLLLNCRGKSGVVREILAYFDQKACSRAS